MTIKMIILSKPNYQRLEGIAKFGYDFKEQGFVPPLTRENAQWLLKEALSETILNAEG